MTARLFLLLGLLTVSSTFARSFSPSTLLDFRGKWLSIWWWCWVQFLANTPLSNDLCDLCRLWNLNNFITIDGRGTLATSIYSNPIFPNLSRLIFQYVLSQSNLPMQCNPMAMLQASFKLLLPVQPTAHPLQQFGELMKMHRTTKYRAQYKYSCK